jgi:hypothetical protein
VFETLLQLSAACVKVLLMLDPFNGLLEVLSRGVMHSREAPFKAAHVEVVWIVVVFFSAPRED